MTEYLVRVKERRAKKLAAKMFEERVIWGQQMAVVREAASLSGIPEWTEAHTIGALFACSSIANCFQQLKQLGLMNDRTLLTILHAIGEQEIICATLGEKLDERVGGTGE